MITKMAQLNRPDLIFVTDILDYICEENSVVWTNVRFLQRI